MTGQWRTQAEGLTLLQGRDLSQGVLSRFTRFRGAPSLNYFSE